MQRAGLDGAAPVDSPDETSAKKVPTLQEDMTMDQRVKPAARLQPLPPEHSPELHEQFESMKRNLGFVPNSILIMQRKPKMAKAFAQMTASIWEPDGKVDRGLKRLIAHVASRTPGCQYCMAHTAGGALRSEE